MSSATFGSYGGGMAERPISVGELLRREGQQSEARDSQTRRALGGVAVGAVLAFGAVVGGLVLHNASATPTDLPMAGGGTAGGAGFNGAVPAASTGTISNAPKIQPAAQVHSTATNNSLGVLPQRNAPKTPSRAPVAAAPNTSTVAPTSDSAPSSQPRSSTTAPATGSSSSSTAPATNPSSSSPGGNSTTSPGSPPPSTPSTSANSGSGGGLLGVVTGTLGDVTHPVFSWFGGN